MHDDVEVARNRLSARVVDAIMKLDSAIDPKTGKVSLARLIREIDQIPALAEDLRRALVDGTITEVRK